MKKNRLGTKNALFQSLARILKNYCHISNKRPPNWVTAKFRAKIRILKFGTKSCLILVFRAAVLKNHCHISNQHPRICVPKIKILKFETKKSDFRILGLEFENVFVIFEISFLEFSLLQS